MGQEQIKTTKRPSEGYTYIPTTNHKQTVSAPLSPLKGRKPNN